MAYQPKDGDISIFKNENAKDNQPTYRGTALINGEPYKISLWVKESTKGKFFAGKIESDYWQRQKMGLPDNIQRSVPRPVPENELPPQDNVNGSDNDGLPF